MYIHELKYKTIELNIIQYKEKQKSKLNFGYPPIG